jgi:hypothetical protein
LRPPSHPFGRLTKGKRTDASAQRGEYRAIAAIAHKQTKCAPISHKYDLGKGPLIGSIPAK